MATPGDDALSAPSHSHYTAAHARFQAVGGASSVASNATSTGINTSTSKSRHNRPVPSPLQEARSASDVSSPQSPGSPSGFPPRIKSQGHVPTTSTSSPTLPVDRVRGPNPGKKAPTSPTIEEFRSVVTRDALREAAAAHSSHGQARNVSAPITASISHTTSPPASPMMNTSAFQSSSHRAELRAVDGQPTMGRTASIDSTVSSNSAGHGHSHGHSQKPSGDSSFRVTHKDAGPQDVSDAIAAAGSAEAAVLKLLNDKNQAASHNAQLWRLVEKQRAMILGLNRDLEKALKEKERYRKKLKDHLVQSQSAPVLAAQQSGSADAGDINSSPISVDQTGVDMPTALPSSVHGAHLTSRKISDSSEVASLGPTRSDTSQDIINPPSSGTQPTTPQSASSGNVTDPVSLPNGQVQASSDHSRANPPTLQPTAAADLRVATLASPQHPSPGFATSPKSLSSPKEGTSRKAPPAPLQLSPVSVQPSMIGATRIVDPSDSEYEDDPDSARAEQQTRGRRKTREEDDRERELLAKQEMEHRSQSKKKSKSKSAAAVPLPEPAVAMPSVSAPQPTAVESMQDARPKQMAYQPEADPVSILRQRAISDAVGFAKSSAAPALMSPAFPMTPGLPLTPGLPMSPRPNHKPLNSPMPRMPNTPMASMPMSPKAGFAGFPLSPRAPRQPLPLIPQTPLTFASPHLARAEIYHQQAAVQQSSVGDRVKLSSDDSPENERPSLSSDPNPKSPGEVYRGLVVEQYPDLLLPPNALPSIFVKTSSPRMKPSRQSFIAPRQGDESPVLTLAVYERSDKKQLWRVEKTVASLMSLDSQIRSACNFRERLPDKALFAGHAPAKIDARRSAMDAYFEHMLEAVDNENAAKMLCKFLSTDVIGAETTDYFPAGADTRPDTPISKLRPQRAGYLTKRGKNFGGWKARYFVLDGPHLKYFEAPGGAHLGSIKLQNAQIGKQSANASHAPQDDEENQFRHAFLILEPKKKDSSSLVRHVLCAESDEERDDWVEALLQYVDFKDDEDEAKGTQFVRPELSGARSPRLQKSTNDLQAPRTSDRGQLGADNIRVVNYNETVAGEAPIIGPSARKTATPSPPMDGNSTPPQEQTATSGHPTISGPTNLHVISNAGDWGMRPPPTPQTARDKKKSMFDYIRGRSSSDTAPGLASPALPPPERTQVSGGRAIFGAPLAEAVEFARPLGIDTELPAVVYRCIEYLTAKNAIAEEGIFRLSGSNTVVKALRDRFNNEGDVNLVAEEQYYDIHAVASLFKLYFRELPVSILTRELHLDFMQCVDMSTKEKVVVLNHLVNQLPRPNRALLEALSTFLLSIVQQADVNKMNVRNVGIVFSPTLNVPAPLISSFVEEQAVIFGPPIEDADSPISVTEMTSAAPTKTTPAPTDLRSPRKQMFSDLPTPAYHQTSFHSLSSTIAPGDVGMIPLQPNYATATYQMAPQGEGGFGSLNDALRSSTLYTTTTPPTPREARSNGGSGGSSKRRESGLMMLSPLGGQAPQKKASMSKLREEWEEEGSKF